jgi:GntR family transcriptional regulator
MFLHVDPSNGLAIYEQVARQIKFAVARGTLKPGQLIPSVRDVARDLAINPNTVARAYQQLQNEEVLVSVRGLGLEVAEGAVARCRQERKKLLQTRLRQVLSEVLQSGLESAELRQLVDQELESALRKGK